MKQLGLEDPGDLVKVDSLPRPVRLKKHTRHMDTSRKIAINSIAAHRGANSSYMVLDHDGPQTQPLILDAAVSWVCSDWPARLACNHGWHFLLALNVNCLLSQPDSATIFGIGAVCYAVKDETKAEAHSSHGENACAGVRRSIC